MAVTLASLAAHLGLTVPENAGSLEISAIRPLHEATPKDLSFLENPAYKDAAKATNAAAVLVKPEDASLLPSGCLALTTPQPYVAFARALQFMYPDVPPAPGISQFAVASAQATIHPTARVEPYAVIYAGAIIGEGAHICAHAVIGSGVIVGAGTRVGPHSTLFKCKVGNGCLLHPGVRVGQDGFGFAVGPGAEKGELELIKVPQIGGVLIGNHVEIGANSTIDCGALGNTVIEDDVKIDNQVQIGHNARIGKGSRIVAQVGIAGSSTLGRYTVIGGQSGVAGHISIADKVMVAARSGVTKSVTQLGSVVAGLPAVPINEWRRQAAALARIARNRVQNPEAKAPAPIAAPQAAPRLPKVPQVPAVVGSVPTPVEDTETDPNTPNPFAY